MQKKMAIGFDLDGVIIDHTSNKLSRAKELGVVLEPRDTASNVFKSRVAPPVYRAVRDFIYGPATLGAPPMEGAFETIRALARTHELHIISRRGAEDGNDAIGFQWLERHGVFDFIPRERVSFVPYNVVGAKDSISRRWGISAYLDDQTKILRELSSVKTRILFDPFDVSPVSEPFFKITAWRDLPLFLESGALAVE